MKGKSWNPKIRERALASMRAGERLVDVSRKLKVPLATVFTWRARSGEFPDGRTSKRATPNERAPKPKPKPASPVGYLAGQLGIIAKMIREKLPELASFTLTTDSDGKASIEYAVRQTRLVSGTVKL